MRLGTRLKRLEATLRDRADAGPLHFLEIVALGDPLAGGRTPGLYRDGPRDSLAGLLIFDPAEGEPEVPAGALAPWGLAVVHGPAVVEPPADMPR